MDAGERSARLKACAWHGEDKAHVSWWDALIIAAAERAGSRWLLTKDLQAGQRFESITVINPFETSPEDLHLQPIARPLGDRRRPRPN